MILPIIILVLVIIILIGLLILFIVLYSNCAKAKKELESQQKGSAQITA